MKSSYPIGGDLEIRHNGFTLGSVFKKTMKSSYPIGGDLKIRHNGFTLGSKVEST